MTSKKHWAVSVNSDGENVVTIESNCLSGRDISDADAELIRDCARQLLAFVGEPSSRADAGGGRAELRRAIMGLAYPDVAAHVCELGPVSAYRLGYKDARYDAAELVLSSPPVGDQGVRLEKCHARVVALEIQLADVQAAYNALSRGVQGVREAPAEPQACGWQDISTAPKEVGWMGGEHDRDEDRWRHVPLAQRIVAVVCVLRAQHGENWEQAAVKAVGRELAAEGK